MSCIIGPLLFIVGMILGTAFIFWVIPWIFSLPKKMIERKKNKKMTALQEMAEDSYLVKRQRFNEDWSLELSCEYLMNEEYSYMAKWSADRNAAMLFSSNEADVLVDQSDCQFRDYPARFTKVTKRQEIAND